jgi:hypothetical protein
MYSCVRTPIEAAERLNLDTRFQYGMMFLFGALCPVAAVAPLDLLVEAVVVSALFGFTARPWVSHLIQTVQSAVERDQWPTMTDDGDRRRGPADRDTVLEVPEAYRVPDR